MFPYLRFPGARSAWPNDASTSTKQSCFKIDNHTSGYGLRYSYHRIIVDDTADIKYLPSLPGSAPSVPDILGERLGFTVPEGDWNVAYLKREPETMRYAWDSAVEQALATVEKIWHPQKVEYLDLGKECVPGSRLKSEGQMFFTIYS